MALHIIINFSALSKISEAYTSSEISPMEKKRISKISPGLNLEN